MGTKEKNLSEKTTDRTSFTWDYREETLSERQLKRFYILGIDRRTSLKDNIDGALLWDRRRMTTSQIKAKCRTRNWTTEDVYLERQEHDNNPKEEADEFVYILNFFSIQFLLH